MQLNERTNTILDGGLLSQLRAAVEDVFTVAEVHIPPKEPQGTIIFEGRLTDPDSEAAYQTIARRWLAYEYTPMLRRGQNAIELVAMAGVVKPKIGNPWVNVALFAVTLISVLTVGTLNEGVDLLKDPAGILKGLPFALSFLAILGTHEFGHYFAARYHKAAVTLPYFIPFPTIWGTFGAFIQLKSPTLTRKQLFDVGVAGPLAGLVITVPVLIIGLLNSTIQPLPAGNEPYILEGNSIFYWLAKLVIFGQALPNGQMDVFLHPLAWAGWSGLLVTMFNLIPVGQLDGGHIAYVLFGKNMKTVGYVVVGLMLVVGIIFWQGWLFWALLIMLFLGTGHPPPLNELAPLDSRRIILGYVMLVIFILIFVPAPLAIIGG